MITGKFTVQCGDIEFKCLTNIPNSKKMKNFHSICMWQTAFFVGKLHLHEDVIWLVVEFEMHITLHPELDRYTASCFPICGNTNGKSLHYPFLNQALSFMGPTCMHYSFQSPGVLWIC